MKTNAPPLRFLLSSRRAFTMMEVLVAMGILAFGVMGLASLRTHALRLAETAANYGEATNRATANLDFCAGFTNYFMMACSKTPAASPNCTGGADPISTPCCPEDAAQMKQFCVHDSTFDPVTVPPATFRDRVTVRRSTLASLKTLVQVDTAVCWNNRNFDTSNAAAKADCASKTWATSSCQYCVTMTLLRTPN